MREMDTNHVPHVYPKGRHKDQPYTGALLHQGSIKVHHLVLLIDDRWWCLDLGPFGDEVSQYLGFDRCSGGICDALIHQLKCPLCSSSRGILALDDLVEGERSYDRHRV